MDNLESENLETKAADLNGQGTVIVPTHPGNIVPSLSPSESIQIQLPNNGTNANQLIITTDSNGQRIAKVDLNPPNGGIWTKPNHAPLSRQSATPAEQASVPKFNGSAPTPPPPINKATQRLKQDNRHEELRRRASYQKVYAEVRNASEPEPQPFTRPSDLPPVQATPRETFQHNRTSATESFQNLNPIKQETSISGNQSSDDSDDDTMSPTQNREHPVVQIATSDINQVNPVLVHLNHGGLQYPSSSLPNPMSLPSYTDMSASALLNHPYKLSDYNNLDYNSDYKDMDDLGAGSDGGGCSDMIGGPVAMVEEASRKREVRLLKNREAARECRRKKKEYIKCLENRVQVLESQNKALIDELKNLKEMYCITKQ